MGEYGMMGPAFQQKRGVMVGNGVSLLRRSASFRARINLSAPSHSPEVFLFESRIHVDKKNGSKLICRRQL